VIELAVAMYVRDTIYSHARPDLVINGLETLWIEIKIERHPVLTSGFYRPPDADLNLIEESFDWA
jgi:hypothetical protein